MSIVGTRPPLISETNLYEPHHKARYLGPSNYGLINYGASIISFFTIISMWIWL